MPRTLFVDFKTIKAAISIEQVLEHYGIRDRFKKSGDSLSGPCPIHGGGNPTQFRVSLSKNIWNCFSKCNRGGNVLDFIANKENVSIHAAALKAIEWFRLDPTAMKGSDDNEKKSNETRETPSPQATQRKTEQKEQDGTANKPLKFKLEKLEREHPYLVERGLSAETITAFEIGYCAKGIMAGRIAIPIRNTAGFIVAYAGRFPGASPEDTPKYKLPPEFKKALELFNIDRAIQEPPEKPLVIVEGFFDCMKLHQHGCRKVAALMGSFMSAKQEELLRKHLSTTTRIILMLDEDEAGQEAREEIAKRLAKFAFVKIHVFDKPGTQPDDLSPEEITHALGGIL